MSAISTHSTHEMWIKPVRWLGGIIISHLKSFVYGQGVLLVSSWAMVAWWRFIMMLMMPWEGRHTHNNLQRLQQKIVLSKIKTLTRFGPSLVVEHQKMKFFNIDVNKIFVRYWIKTLKIWEGTTISLPVFKAWKLKKKVATRFSENEGRGSKAVWNFGENSSDFVAWPVPSLHMTFPLADLEREFEVLWEVEKKQKVRARRLN